MSIIDLPLKLNERLEKDPDEKDLIVLINSSLIPFSQILHKNEFYFFPEYTDHGINHINNVLETIEALIPENILDKLSAIEICLLKVSVFLHDLGLQTNPEVFKNMLVGAYDNIEGNQFEEITWKELWKAYLKESRYWDAEKRVNIIGDSNYFVKATDKDIDEETDKETITYKISHPLLYDERDKRFIGEFIRRHHARLAYEIALKGYIGKYTYDFKHEGLPRHFMQLAGLIARSHGMHVRDTFDILKKLYGSVSWKKPQGIKVVLLMILIRLADYLQIGPSRSNNKLLRLRTMFSPYSLQEYDLLESIDSIRMDDNESTETIIVEASPVNARIFIRIENLIQEIQHEFNQSCAILDEVYGDCYQLRYRYIISNISDESVKDNFSFVPKQFGFKFSNATASFKPLIAPLYGDNPSFGVRELVQNAVDACRARMAYDMYYSNQTECANVTVSLDSDNKLFSIVDNGIGMTIDEIEKYFFTLGSSSDTSIEWQMIRDIFRIYRTGRFGIGIFAAFIIGQEIRVKTKSAKTTNDYGYQFTLKLNEDFIQIDKIDLPHYGTAIEITCYDNALQQLKDEVFMNELYVGTNKWFGWYIDSNPNVNYIYNNKHIKISHERLKNYKLLHTDSLDFGDIKWEPELLFSRSLSIFKSKRCAHSLFCNGFFITNDSEKRQFSIPGVEKYIPSVIPSLMISDIFNQIPLNIKRSNIDHMTEFCFEKDLAIAECKDILCQLLAIEESLIKAYDSPLNHHFFYNRSGYVINQYKDYFSLHDCDKDSQYKELHFQGKKLVHVYYGSNTRLNMPFWEQFISEHPNAFFSFIPIGPEDIKRIEDLFIRREMNHDLYHYSSVVPVLSLDVFCAKYEYSQDITIKELIHNAKTTSHEYSALADDPLNKNFVNDLISQLDCNSDSDKDLFYFAIHNIMDNPKPSPLDDFIDEYAGGDMIIPFHETERRKKFAKLYAECGEDIERYRNIVHNNYTYRTL